MGNRIGDGVGKSGGPNFLQVLQAAEAAGTISSEKANELHQLLEAPDAFTAFRRRELEAFARSLDSQASIAAPPQAPVAAQSPSLPSWRSRRPRWKSQAMPSFGG